MGQESRSGRKYPALASEATLLIGLLYHGSQQHDALVMRNIFKDGLERAHKLHAQLLKRKL